MKRENSSPMRSTVIDLASCPGTLKASSPVLTSASPVYCFGEAEMVFWSPWLMETAHRKLQQGNIKE